MLSNINISGPLSLDHVVNSLSDGSPKTVLDILKENHPCGRAGDSDTIPDPVDSSELFHLVLFENSQGRVKD